VSESGKLFYNSLEAPALDKYPLLTLFQEFFRANGALATLMSGSGSTTFAIAQDQDAGRQLVKKFKDHFGSAYWSAVCLLN
jgi:4-diphosphocytidyl-2-C-methyl-D-erythritol kinase